MSQFDLVIRNGTVATGTGERVTDIGVKDGLITALDTQLSLGGKRDIDAAGLLVLPGGIEAHCHIEQMSSMRVMTSDDFYSGSVSAAFGGNTTIVPFAAQHKGMTLRETVDDYMARAEAKSVIDFGFHLIVTDPTPEVLGQELPAQIKAGITSFKVFMTYDAMKLTDSEMLDVLTCARREGALAMVHAENHDMIKWLADRLTRGGHTAPKFHAMAHARLAEAEATHRAVTLARLADTPLLVVHVSSEEAADEIKKARAKGLEIYAETCPQYLFLTADDLDLTGVEGAKFCCSPPPRDKASQEAIWRGLEDGTFHVFHSDHAPYAFDETAKLHAGPNPPFTKIANGVPGIELRMPLLFSEGVNKGRITLQRFVDLTATNAAKLYGLHPRKGEIALGADADLAIWDKGKQVTVTWDKLHDNVGYTPYEGMELTGWPIIVINRGAVVVDDGELFAGKGDGCYLERSVAGMPKPAGLLEPEIDPKRNFGAEIL
jgi:dihydropyrimidinase